MKLLLVAGVLALPACSILYNPVIDAAIDVAIVGSRVAADGLRVALAIQVPVLTATGQGMTKPMRTVTEASKCIQVAYLP